MTTTFLAHLEEQIPTATPVFLGAKKTGKGATSFSGRLVTRELKRGGSVAENGGSESGAEETDADLYRLSCWTCLAFAHDTAAQKCFYGGSGIIPVTQSDNLAGRIATPSLPALGYR